MADARRAVSGSSSEILVWDLLNGGSFSIDGAGSIDWIAAKARGQTQIVRQGKALTRLESGRKQRIAEGEYDSFRELAVSGDEQRIIVGGSAGLGSIDLKTLSFDPQFYASGERIGCITAR